MVKLFDINDTINFLSYKNDGKPLLSVIYFILMVDILFYCSYFYKNTKLTISRS